MVGPHADVGSAGQGLRVYARDGHGEHSGQGQALALDLDVGGRKTDGAADLLAVHDAPGDDEGAPEQLLGMLDVSGGQRLAHRRTGNPDAAEVDRMHRLDHETVFLPGTLQHREIAATRLAEAEVVADDQVPDRQAAHQDLLDELLARQRRQLAVEAADMHAIDAGIRPAARSCRACWPGVVAPGRARTARADAARRSAPSPAAQARAPWPSIRQAVRDGRDARHRNCRWSAPWTSWPAREHREKPAWELA
jgi:hypothetical protein